MSGAVYLAWKYLAYHRWKTGILVLSISMIASVPAGLRVLVAQSAAQLTARAEATPLLLGAKGSPLELVLNSLYFEARQPPTLPSTVAGEVNASGLARAIPLHVRFNARGFPVVGTSLEYLELRRLRISRGRSLAMLGECVVGADVARTLDLKPGDSLVTSPENVFDLAGVYPLRMPVVGVLAASLTPDDAAVFVDLKTAWVIEGLGHGHQDLRDPEAAGAVLSADDTNVTANASLVQYEEITADNVDEYHFHGDLAQYPVTAVIAVPDGDKPSALLQGRYQDHDALQLVRPDRVMNDLLDTVFTVQGFVIAAVALVGSATLLTAVLVFALSVRLRRREMLTMQRIGASRGRVFGVLALEVWFVVAAAVVLAGVLTLVAAHHGMALVRAVILT